MRILLFGSEGQVGWELRRSLAPLGRVVAHDRRSADLEDHARLRGAVREAAPDVVVNAAAWTGVDAAEGERDRALRVNAEAPGVLAREARRTGALLVHYSTDHVFDGSKGAPYVEDDPPRPVNEYGRTKLLGEEAVRGEGCRLLLFRTSWVFSPRRTNFVRTVLGLAGRRRRLAVVADQAGCPTGAALVARVTALALAGARDGGGGLDGVYHLASAGWTTRLGLAREAVARARAEGMGLMLEGDVEPAATADRPRPARRPPDSRLDAGRLSAALGAPMPPWESCVAGTVAEIARAEAAGLKEPARAGTLRDGGCAP